MHTLNELRQMVEGALEKNLRSLGDIPQPLLDAMLYSLCGGGKRVRSVLLLAACEAGCGTAEEALPFACALEMIHTYSCVHDDLPGMDNDDMRRNRPSNHKVYGEGIAILAGDGLLNGATELMIRESIHRADGRGIQCMEAIMRRAGVTGMIAGQDMDLTMENEPVREDVVRYIHAHKTADLLTAPLEGGLRLAGAQEELVQAGIRFGFHLGMAFQQMDDLLDVVGDPKEIGKAVGRDAEEGKQTWVTLRGIDGTREDMETETREAMKALDAFGERGIHLREMAVDMLNRTK